MKKYKTGECYSEFCIKNEISVMNFSKNCADIFILKKSPDKNLIDKITNTSPFFQIYTKNNIIFKLGAPFYTKISTDNREIGREYYVLELENGKQWIDIDTGLPIMIFGYSSSTQYYKDTKIPIDKIEIISEYQYEFNTVTDEDVELPDLSEFEIDN